MLDFWLMLIVGVTFVAGGAYIARCALEAKNMIEAAMFGLMGATIGLFLISVAFFGTPEW
jgi:hypothetical protein